MPDVDNDDPRKTEPPTAKIGFIKLASLIDDLESKSVIGNRKRANSYEELATIREAFTDLVRKEARPFCDRRTVAVVNSRPRREIEAEIGQ